MTFNTKKKADGVFHFTKKKADGVFHFTKKKADANASASFWKEKNKEYFGLAFGRILSLLSTIYYQPILSNQSQKYEQIVNKFHFFGFFYSF